MKTLLKILSLLGLGSVGTGLGFGMENGGADPWQIALSLFGLFFTWFLTTKWALWYARFKAFVHEFNDMIADDKVTIEELRDCWMAWKTGVIQPD